MVYRWQPPAIYKSRLVEQFKVFPEGGALLYRKERVHMPRYAQASTVIHCPTNEATNHYVIFLTVVHQGL